MWVVSLVVFMGLMLLNVPVSFSIIATGLIAVLMTGGTLPAELLPQRMIYGCDDVPSMAVPLFMLAGNLMNSAGLGRRLIRLARALVGHLPGGLSHVNVLDSMFFAGMSGSAVADTLSLGTIIIPAMIEEGYPASFAAVLTAASSTVGPIIPPSIGAVIMAAQCGLPVGRLFLGGAIPGIIMGLFMLADSYIISKKRGYPRTSGFSWRELGLATGDASLALLIPVLVILSVSFGVTTATEVAVVIVLYSLFLGLVVYRSYRVKEIPSLLRETAESTADVMLMCGAASILGWLLGWSGLTEVIARYGVAIAHATSPWVVLLLINLLLLVAGCFITVIANILLWTPTILAITTPLGFDPVHIGIMVMLNLHIGLITPPVGICMFTCCKIAKVPIVDFVREAWHMYVALACALLLVTFCPSVVTWLPNLILGPAK